MTVAKYAIILAAGKGTRMKSKLYKVLHPIAGRPMVDHVLTEIEANNMDEVVTIVGHGAEKVEETLGDRSEYALQAEQLGTGHAVLQAEKILKDKEGMTIIANGDTPLLTAKTFGELFEYHKEKGAAATVLTAQAEDPTGYGRIIRNEIGIVEKIVEQKDATIQEANVQEINTGVYCFDNKTLFAALHEVTNDNAQGEYYLTDVMEILKKQGKIVAAYRMKDFSESMGVNDRVALSAATKVMQRRINEMHMRNGVTLVDPDNTYIECDVKIGSDTVIEPGVYLKGKTVIGEDCYIGAHSEIIDSIVHDNVTVTASYLEDSVMETQSNIGPYSHLRPQAHIGEAAHIGNFVEIKNASIGKSTKVGHLTYVGDATLGKDINVGCGVVFVNYDGVNKHHTNVGDHSFIGSGSNLVAPLEVGDHAFIAAGSTITDNVDSHDLGIARGRQVNKKGYFDKLPVADAPEIN
ncbi:MULTISPECIES: bifunctional UDP-N-acetylglucosamine diphosphorylase/glucosamine-1-phosphate N-acetyltransferase GlmU [Dellaglioa]|uniref:Bifunctional protein GlmU n=3 Tax=Dellaglioa TaxID=2767880 RepID=A0A0R1HFH3_9LACO|nr:MULTISPECIES: bifunctional UDP-N-acetylglucosamine diphosphorylase/glucosamine-1-phosphate N-acetyltransferase GlmU [Dellaglioa]KRK45213.1 bifunctional N-acetylglucosamine-1-phosphate uridyltransferase glucosamine-1-phosphate acetyltransferase [Dellaglioa algida DSM 15638]MCZ2491690.1 bifunctional UDP-N-acetylglucosamine diphosphorylase/glucosamine-1-phosphate N-acetyltransferase GlmU [Dellaglioa carnosa]MCZ2493500.1 bifunctional UDP-N-acetylglucosamine diphosphorylase/glucosamine-1-phosphate